MYVCVCLVRKLYRRVGLKIISSIAVMKSRTYKRTGGGVVDKTSDKEI